jgi:hypothetical protein
MDKGKNKELTRNTILQKTLQKKLPIVIKLLDISSSQSPKRINDAYRIIFEIARLNILAKKGGDTDEKQS